MQDRCVSRAQDPLPAPIVGRCKRWQNYDPRLDHDRIAAHLLAADIEPVELFHTPTLCMLRRLSTEECIALARAATAAPADARAPPSMAPSLPSTTAVRS
jgi:hypothetical protein